MSEDSCSTVRMKKEEEGKSFPDFFGSVGKGMLIMEKLRSSTGLTPLRFDADTGKTSGNSPGLAPLRFQINDLPAYKFIRIEPQMNADERSCGRTGIKNDEAQGLLSCFSAPAREEFPKKRGI